MKIYSQSWSSECFFLDLDSFIQIKHFAVIDWIMWIFTTIEFYTLLQQLWIIKNKSKSIYHLD
jgi:hypothetical protein